MKRTMRTSVLAVLLFCGCAGRMNTDLLQARIREQASQLTETQRELAKTKSELKQSRLDAQLKSEFAQPGHIGDPIARSDVQISKLHIYPLASGGLNKDDLPGDDTIVVQFAPFDRDNEPARMPGQIQFTLLDPRLPESQRQLGQWSFSAEECRNHWTRGITSSGFQFNLPLDQPPQHTDLVVKLQFKTADERRFETSQIVKVMPQGMRRFSDSDRAKNRSRSFPNRMNRFLPWELGPQNRPKQIFPIGLRMTVRRRRRKAGFTVAPFIELDRMLTIPQIAIEFEH